MHVCGEIKRRRKENAHFSYGLGYRVLMHLTIFVLTRNELSLAGR